MKAVTSDLPDADGNWGYEIKWDGMRVLAFCDQERVRLLSSTGNDITNTFPELQNLRALAIGFESLILDGEVVAFGEHGLPKFNILQHRMHVQDQVEASKRSHDVPITFAIFDLLGLNQQDTMGLPLSARRKLLEGIVEDGSHWRLTNQTDSEPGELLRTVTERGIEGIVAKRLDSTYAPGTRNAAWVKVKPSHRQEFVVAGWIEGREGLKGGLGSLALGVMAPDVDGTHCLVPCGTVGSGLTNTARSWWHAELLSVEAAESPFTGSVSYPGRTVHWVEPRYVVEVAFAEWTDDGRLRHPVYLGRRSDKAPSDITREDQP